jgi:lysine-specific demethylase/histidyl-hydroxylase NO66
MSEQAWMNDVIGYLVDPETSENFFEKYHEKDALIAPHNDPGRYLSLLSIQRIDDLISSHDFPAGTLDMTSANAELSREDYTFSSGYADRGAVSRHFQNGATIILPQLHMTDPQLASFCRSVEAKFSCHTQTNIYLTPPDSQGFKTHYDDHDVFVLQVSGSKTWRLYNTPVENPYRGEGFRSGDHEIGDPIAEFVLNAGDCVYVPRGMLHDASTHGDEASLHITVGLIVKTWADLMLEAVSEVALREPEFRRSLPVGFARPDFDRTESEAFFKTLTTKLSQEADLEASFDIFVDNFIRSRTPNTAGTIAGFQIPLEEGQKFSLRKNVPWRLAEDGEEVVIITSGGEVRFPAAAESGLHALLDGGTISSANFKDLPDNQPIATIQRLYAYGLTDPVK